MASMQGEQEGEMIRTQKRLKKQLKKKGMTKSKSHFMTACDYSFAPPD